MAAEYAAASVAKCNALSDKLDVHCKDCTDSLQVWCTSALIPIDTQFTPY